MLFEFTFFVPTCSSQGCWKKQEQDLGIARVILYQSNCLRY